MNAAEFAQRHERPHKTASGWQVCCRAHDDSNASLSVSDGDDGKVLLKCHAGCSFNEICAAAGVDPKELFPPKQTNQSRRILAVYPYTDASGKHLFDVIRYDPKDFRQRRPDPSRPGQYLWSIKVRS